MRWKYRETLRGVRIPTWALSYLVNGDDSGLGAKDKKTVDEWVEKTRNGGRIDICPPPDAIPHFTWHPAFGLACDVYGCDVVVDMSPRYKQNPCIRFGQSRFGPAKRTALDGKTWWCVYDYRNHKYGCYRFKTRRQALVQLELDIRSGRLPYEPDPGFSLEWLKARTILELRDLVDRREPAWLGSSLDAVCRKQVQ